MRSRIASRRYCREACGILYTASTEVIIGTGSTLVVQPLPSGERTIIQRGGYFGRYVAAGTSCTRRMTRCLRCPSISGDWR